MRGGKNTNKHDTFEARGKDVGTPHIFSYFLLKKHSPPLGCWVGWGLVGWVAGLAGLGWLGWLGWLVGWLGWLGWLVGWLGWLAKVG